MEARVAIESHNLLGEGPVWSVDDQCLYWVDIPRFLLQRWDFFSHKIKQWELPSEIGSFAIRRSGGFVVALRTGLAFFDPGSGNITHIVDPGENLSQTRFNDGKCDRMGRFWAGTMDEIPGGERGSLYRLAKGLVCKPILSKIGISNGLGWSPDNSIFYYTDSMKHKIWAFDFNAESGGISNQRIFAETPKNYVPDGLTVDAEGFVWSAKWDGWKVVRYSPDGSIDLEVQFPIQRPTSCTFGGPDLDLLFITSASQGINKKELKNQPNSGNVFVFETNVKGFPEPYFVG